MFSKGKIWLTRDAEDSYSIQFAPGDRLKHLRSRNHQEILCEYISVTLQSTSAQQRQNSQMIEEAAAPTGSNPLTTNEGIEKQYSIASTTEILAKAVEVVKEDRERIRAGFSQQSDLVQAVAQQTATLQTSVEETRSHLSGLQVSMRMLQEQVQSLKDRRNDMRSVSYDGTMIWKLTDVHEKIGKPVRMLTLGHFHLHLSFQGIPSRNGKHQSTRHGSFPRQLGIRCAHVSTSTATAMPVVPISLSSLCS